MKRALAALLLALGLTLPFAGPKALIADLSDHLVAITTGFAGKELLIFGTVEEGGDIVVTVRGPGRDITMHRKESVLGLWLNTASFSFVGAPSFYAIAATKPLADLASEGELERLKVGLDHMILTPKGRASANLAEEWADAFVRAKQRAGLYGEGMGEVTMISGKLFRARIVLPTNVPTGTYLIDAYQFVDGQAVAAQSLPLVVSKIGMEAEIYDFAQEQGALYGLSAIGVALLAGWLAHLVFRRR